MADGGGYFGYEDPDLDRDLDHEGDDDNDDEEQEREPDLFSQVRRLPPTMVVKQ